MIRALRSIIDFNDLPLDELQRNFLFLCDSRLKFPSNSQEKEIFDFIREFYYSEYNENQEIPSIATLIDFFGKENNSAALEKLEEIKTVPASYKGADFDHLIRDLYEAQQKSDFADVIRLASQVNATGVKVEKEFLMGPKAASRLLYERCNEFITEDLSEKLKFNIRDDSAADRFLERYEEIKNDPTLGMGRLIGLEKIDEICRGLRKGEMMLVAGFSGNMKTTLCLNYAYNTAIFFGYNVYYLTLEMSTEQVQRIVYCLHSEHPLFKTDPRYKEFYRRIEYKNLRDGTLSPDEEKFFKIVLNDWKTNPRYGNFFIEKPETDVTVSDIQAKIEREYRNAPIDLVIVDEARLVSPKRKYNSTTESWNDVLKDLKQLALRFGGGEGIPIITPFQTNRQGYREAEKNEGEYKQDCLSYANEAERSSDVIIYTYLDPNLRQAQEIKIGNLKNRDNELFKSFKARVVGHARRIENLEEDDE